MDEEPWEEILSYYFMVRTMMGQPTEWKGNRNDPRISQEEIAEILFAHDGAHDYEEDWQLLFRMKDGRYCHVWAGCCYTGFSASGSVDCFIHENLDYLVSYGITWEQRFRYFFSRNIRETVRAKLHAVRHRT